MRYPYVCESPAHFGRFQHGEYLFGEPFEITAPMATGPPQTVVCPFCLSDEYVRRIYHTLPVHYNAKGFSRDYFDKNPGRGQSWDKKEYLNSNWSKYYGEDPPKEDSKGTYDGR